MSAYVWSFKAYSVKPRAEKPRNWSASNGFSKLPLTDNWVCFLAIFRFSPTSRLPFNALLALPVPSNVSAKRVCCEARFGSAAANVPTRMPFPVTDATSGVGATTVFFGATVGVGNGVAVGAGVAVAVGSGVAVGGTLALRLVQALNINAHATLIRMLRRIVLVISIFMGQTPLNRSAIVATLSEMKPRPIQTHAKWR